ncbi:hypothetical protein BV25DRAFT_1821241 [Artomyces pyxidatus]|uniref:Uncharacterized protein n=1 Tax=Artomyces pyxidatus TaxID=48021 RepID=A0ACB8TDE9_9AGAM|nr:hypothetical protein BV25DRAFT_1821241 [Artomyces pyxidatus]
MPLASSGPWLSIGRQVLHAPSINPSRALHTFPRPPPSSSAQRLVQQTKGLFKALLGHLTTPGLRQPGRSLHAVATRYPTIQSGLSLPVRHALARPFGAPKLPHPPAVPRSIAQVGLGTARNFTTGRPIFQSLADNVPIAGRAFVEADWEMKMKEERKLQLRKAKRSQKAKARRAVRAQEVEFHPAAAPEVETVAELNHYFPEPAAPAVTTTLLIPLAPTPTSRLPLAPSPVETRHPLLPFSELSALHYDHMQHATRVSELFARLDGANVWGGGAQCDVYGDRRGASVLRVRFAGWEAKAVRGVIGESGSGWCVLEEERAPSDADESDLEAILEHMSAAASDFPHAPDGVDPSQSVVLPTLDFSASSPVYAPPRAPSRSGMSSVFGSDVHPSDFDTFSDAGSFSDGSGSCVEPPPASIRSSGWIGFSSSFVQRMEDDGPREALF